MLETASLNETKLAEYCCKRGVYTDQVLRWRDACLNANKPHNCAERRREQAQARTDKKEVKRLEKELTRKEKALAETAALLVLQKKGECDLGTGRGRMIRTPDRVKAIELIDETVNSGSKTHQSV